LVVEAAVVAAVDDVALAAQHFGAATSDVDL